MTRLHPDLETLGTPSPSSAGLGISVTPLHPDLETATELLEVAQGKRAAEAYIAGGQVLNVYSGEVLPQNIAVHRRRIAYVGLQQAMVGPDTRVIDASGYYLVPGYVNAHEHGDVLYTPTTLAQEVLGRGTTTIFCNGRHIPFLMGPKEFGQMVEELSSLPIKLFWGIETGRGAYRLGPDDLLAQEPLVELLNLERVFGLHEVVRWTDVVGGDPTLLQVIVTSNQHARRVEGHTAGASYDKLNAVAAAGVHSCHESINLQDVLNRLRLGLYVMVRCSSIRPNDLPDMLGAVTKLGLSTSRLILVPDGLIPADVVEKGNMDYLVARTLEAGVAPSTAYQMASLNPATYFGVEGDLGGIAPRRWADILFLEDLRKPTPVRVMSNGQIVADGGSLLAKFPEPSYYRLIHNKLVPSHRSPALAADLFRVPGETGRPFPLIELVSSVINRRVDVVLPSRNGFLVGDREAGILNVALLATAAGRVTRGFIKGFGARVGGLAGTADGPNELLVLGYDPDQMAVAANRVRELRGGIVIIDQGRTLFELRLPVGGIMSPEPLPVLANQTRELARLLKGMGFPFDDLHYTLGTLTWYFLPQLRLTAGGILDVRLGQIVVPSTPL